MGLIWPRMQCLYLRLKPRLGAGLPSLLGLRLISKMASFHHPRRARLPLWFAGKRIQPKPKGFLVLTHSHTSLLYAKWTCWKRNHWKASSWGFFFGGGSLEGLPFTWPGKPLPSAQEAYSPFAGYPNSVAVTHESDECWTREHTFVNRAECHGNKISILMKKKNSRLPFHGNITPWGCFGFAENEKYQNRIKHLYIYSLRTSKASQDGNLSIG